MWLFMVAITQKAGLATATLLHTILIDFKRIDIYTGTRNCVYILCSHMTKYADILMLFSFGAEWMRFPLDATRRGFESPFSWISPPVIGLHCLLMDVLKITVKYFENRFKVKHGCEMDIWATKTLLFYYKWWMLRLLPN